MSFIITSDDRGLVPILVCEECHGAIKTMDQGTAMWFPANDLDELGDDDDFGVSEPHVVILHKGACSRKYDSVYRLVGDHLHCMELDQFFEAWFQGAQFLSYDRDAAKRRLEMMRTIQDF